MKKVLFIIGVLILLSGIMIARPDDTRSLMERTGSYQDSIEEPYNSTYNRTYDALGENTDIAGYGAAMVGIILIALSAVNKKKKEAGLLYQSPEHQQILPEHLEARAKKAPPISSNSEEEREFELPETPDRIMASSAQGTGFPSPPGHGPIQDLAGASGIPSSSISSPAPPPVFQQTAPPSFPGMPSPPPLEPERTFKCSECGEIFTMRGNVKEVICPKCGTRYNLEGL